jgi:hypothetical protein
MRHEVCEFVGGPLDGRRMEVVVGMTGQPPREYVVPVDGRRHMYHRERGPATWVFRYDEDGRPPAGPKWPWSRRR